MGSNKLIRREKHKLWVQMRSGIMVRIQRGCEENDFRSNKLIKRLEECGSEKYNLGKKKTRKKKRFQIRRGKSYVSIDKEEKEQFGFH